MVPGGTLRVRSSRYARGFDNAHASILIEARSLNVIDCPMRCNINACAGAGYARAGVGHEECVSHCSMLRRSPVSEIVPVKVTTINELELYLQSCDTHSSWQVMENDWCALHVPAGASLRRMRNVRAAGWCGWVLVAEGHSAGKGRDKSTPSCGTIRRLAPDLQPPTAGRSPKKIGVC